MIVSEWVDCYEFDVKCPYCGYNCSDNPEISTASSLKFDEQQCIEYCPQCEKEFAVRLNVEYTYHTGILNKEAMDKKAQEEKELIERAESFKPGDRVEIDNSYYFTTTSYGYVDNIERKYRSPYVRILDDNKNPHSIHVQYLRLVKGIKC